MACIIIIIINWSVVVAGFDWVLKQEVVANRS